MEKAVDNPLRTLELLNITGFDKLDVKTTKNLAWIHATELVRMMGYENKAKNYPDVLLSVAEDIDG